MRVGTHKLPNLKHLSWCSKLGIKEIRFHFKDCSEILHIAVLLVIPASGLDVVNLQSLYALLQGIHSFIGYMIIQLSFYILESSTEYSSSS